MGSISKRKMASAIVAFLCTCMLCFAQDAGGQGVSDSSIQTSSAINEADLPIGNTQASGTQLPETQLPQPRGGSTVFLLLRMIAVLSFVIVCIYFAIWFMRRSNKTTNINDPFLRVVSGVSLSPGKAVHVVTLLEHAYIVGVSDNSVNLIGEVTDKELVAAMNSYADKQENTTKPKNFDDILAIFMPSGQRGNGRRNVFDGLGNPAERILKRQRERLRDGE